MALDRQNYDHEKAWKDASPFVLRPGSAQGKATWNSNRIIDMKVSKDVVLRIPICNGTPTEGERHRIEIFATGKGRICNFYNDLMQRWNHATLNEVIQADNSNTDLASGIHLFRTRNDEPHLLCEGDEDGTLNLSISNDNAAIQLLHELVSGIESRGFGSVATDHEVHMGFQQADDIACVYRLRKLQSCALWIRPRNIDGTAYLKIVFGSKQWRGCIDVLTCKGNTSISTLEMNCSCSIFECNNACEHSELVLTNQQLRLRIRSLFQRQPILASAPIADDDWAYARIPTLVRDEYVAWNMFKRKFLGMAESSFATVTLDIRTGKLALPLKYRIQCRVCVGRSFNVGTCVHEDIILSSINQSLQGIRRTKNDKIGLLMDGCIGILPTEGDPDTPFGKEEAETFVSKMKRNVFPCKSENRITKNVMSTIRKKGNDGRTTQPESYFFGIDFLLSCSNCKKSSRNNVGKGWNDIGRSALLHTLSYGSMKITVQDTLCDCGAIIRYDGLSDGLFCASKHNVFTRELLDVWVFDVCGLGMTFREAFTSWKRKARSVNALEQCIHDGPSISRRMANEAFGLYLKSLRFPSKHDLQDLFSCTQCELKDPNGQRQWKGVVMDGTATGILNSLPKFNRPTSIVQAIKGISDMQYIMPPPKLREFTDCMFLSAKKNEGKIQFYLDLSKRIRNQAEELRKTFFGAEPPSKLPHPSSVLVRSFLNLLYVVMEEENTDELRVPNIVARRKFLVRHNIMDLDLRRTAIEFGRCFISGSIAGLVFRQESSSNLAAQIVPFLNQFSSCAHAGCGVICNQCTSDLSVNSKRICSGLPAVSRMLKSLCDASIYGSEGHDSLRRIAVETACILERAIEVRRNYFHLFSLKQEEDIRTYKYEHMQGEGLEQDMTEDWLLLAAKTGQIFPGHPMVRPSIDFGKSTRNENESHCRKDYRASDTHSPGIFTVQCVCRYPKVIGVSVMDECEGTSTAMSVLLSRFKLLPKVCYYDNSCNLAKSIILRTPWVNEKCLIVSDRFHYRGHKCNVVNDPDSYALCRMHSTSGAESINQHWNFSKSHVRFLSPENLMPFLAIRTVFLNIRARIREKYEVTDIDDTHYSKFIDDAWICSCNICNIGYQSL